MDMQEWLLKQWKHFGKTIIFITHDVEEAIFLSNSIYIIQDRPFEYMEKVKINSEYPRDREFLKNTEIVALREELINKLRNRREQ